MAGTDPRDALSGAVYHPPELFPNGPAPQPVGRFGMLPYTRWSSSDARSLDSLGQAEVKARLLDVVKTEGPILLACAELACCHWKRRIRRKSSALVALVAHELLVQRAIHVRGVVGSRGAVLHAAASPSVSVRTLGPRHFEEVPSSEVAELMVRTHIDLADERQLFQTVLAAYGLSVPFASVLQHLRRALKVARSG